MNDGMPGKMEERPPIVPALKGVVADLLREAQTDSFCQDFKTFLLKI